MHSTPDSPEAAVRSWWQMMQDADVPGLRELTCEDYIAAGGPAFRTTDQEAFLQEAAEFLASGTITQWQIREVRTRIHGDVAVCSYWWHERGDFDGRPFEFGGLATDVLVRRPGGWRHQAHHVSSVNATPTPSEPEGRAAS